MNTKHSKLRSIFLIVFGTALLAMAYQCVFDMEGLVTGGFTGLAIVIKHYTGLIIEGGVPLWLTNIALNVPVFIVGYFVVGKRFIGKTLFGTAMLSFWLYVIPAMKLSQGDLFMAALFGGVIAGVGMGMVLRASATTGGTDMVAAIIHKKIRHYSVVQIMQVLDALVVVLGLFVFGIRNTLYAIVAIVVMAKVSDLILEGFKYSKAAFIITDHHEEVAQRIMKDIDRGVTGLTATGMYTGNSKCVLYCVVDTKQIVEVKELVNEIDPNAFVIVSDVHEVLGEGFQEYVKDAF